MILLNTIEKTMREIESQRNSGKKIGFVPTMGALHAGHLSLVRRCVAENDYCVVSIFVNPTQFNDKKDLATYPHTLDADAKLLVEAGCDLVFAPSEEEMYPEPDTRQFDFGGITSVMEGAFRPGHFNGVAQIVSKLFDVVKPDQAYFGEKDFQQVAVIRAMVKQLNMPVNIVSCPIIREEDGLAMSSRNVRLTPEQRQKAPLIALTLKESTKFVPEKSVDEVICYVTDSLSADPVFRPDYFSIVDGYTLQPVQSWDDANYIVGCIAIYCGDVRLIDNIMYRRVEPVE